MDELKRLHASKVRAMLAHTDKLEKQIKQLRRESKENYRVKMIKNFKVQIREQEAIMEALKSKCSSFGLTIEQICELYDTALDQPKRARPPRPEELQKEMAKLVAENKKLRAKGRGGVSSKVSSGLSSPRSEPNFDVSVSQAELQQLSISKATVEAQEEAIQAHQTQIKMLQTEMRKLRRYKEKWRESETQIDLMRSHNEELRNTMLTAVEESEKMNIKMRQIKAAPGPGEESSNGNSDKMKEMQILLEQAQEREQSLEAQVTLLQSDLSAAHRELNGPVHEDAMTAAAKLLAAEPPVGAADKVDGASEGASKGGASGSTQEEEKHGGDKEQGNDAHEQHASYSADASFTMP